MLLLESQTFSVLFLVVSQKVSIFAVPHGVFRATDIDGKAL
jgi:hypothetical protein